MPVDIKQDRGKQGIGRAKLKKTIFEGFSLEIHNHTVGINYSHNNSTTRGDEIPYRPRGHSL